MQRFKRPLVMVTALALVAALGSTAAFAAPGKGRFGARAGHGGLGPFMAGGFGGFAGPGLGVLGGGGFWAAPAWAARVWVAWSSAAREGRSRGAVRGSSPLDVLTPAASFLGISVSTLAADLKGGKTLAQEATAKGKTASALIDAIVASEKTVLDAENSAGWITDAQETSMLSRHQGRDHEARQRGPARAADEEARAARDGRDLSRHDGL